MTSSTVVFNTAGNNPNATRTWRGRKLNGYSSNPTNIITNSIIAYNTGIANPGDLARLRDYGYSSPPFSSSYNLVQYPEQLRLHRNRRRAPASTRSCRLRWLPTMVA